MERVELNANFRKTLISYGIVIRADIDTIEKIKKYLSELPDVTVIFQLVDGGRLWIVRENERRGEWKE